MNKHECYFNYPVSFKLMVFITPALNINSIHNKFQLPKYYVLI